VSAYQEDDLVHFSAEAVFATRRKSEKHNPRKLDKRCQFVCNDERSKQLQDTLVRLLQA
jgi:hypothetical protein